jgi:hypothetical protein
MPAIVHFGGVKKLEDAGPLQVSGAAARGVEVVTYRTGHAVLVYLTYIDEEVTGLSAAVVPLFQKFRDLRVMSSKAYGAEENEIGALFWRIVDAQFQPLGCTEM